ncbi:conjugal transfer protein TraA [Acidithiobacillus marinus]|uniref:Conjugal transfer protein TraA n=1 Tax=Acidithiobacillus marinus TaxID=187490 RepID=A0A2I1DPM2_9PROT|nr:conjugal transfer protein TraA [Acidithiobacillus marinus]PKY11835.1 conjugal transfer protein TraA [Acidithiobacillus marinus]
MEAVMQSTALRYQLFMEKMNSVLSSKKVVVTAALMVVAALALMIQAHAGTGGTSFSAVATKIEGWAQGDLGLAIVAGGLIFGVASMVFTGRGTVLAIVVGGAVALYYGIPVLINIFAATAGAGVAKTLIVSGAHAAGVL